MASASGTAPEAEDDLDLAEEMEEFRRRHVGCGVRPACDGLRVVSETCSVCDAATNRAAERTYG